MASRGDHGPPGPCACPFGEGVEVVDELHHRRDRGVHLLPDVDVLRDAPDGLVRLAPNGALVGRQRARDRSRSAAAAAPAPSSRHCSAMRHTRASQRKLPSSPESVHSTSFSGGATNITYRRSASAPTFCDHRVGIDDVALGLRHHGAVLQHHALGQQVRERLAVVDHAEVAEHAREEARVDQVQDRVLDAAAVEIHRAPVRRPWPDRTAVRSLCASAKR